MQNFPKCAMGLKRFILTAILLFGLAIPAFAVDGVIGINQAKVTAAGGFPFVINQSGSYRLTGNLLVTGGTNGIEIHTDRVTVDLNGFAIQGGSSSGIGITLGGPDPKSEIAVINGTISGMSGGGIILQPAGFKGRIENMRIVGPSTQKGIETGGGFLIKNNVISRMVNCINAGRQSIVTENILDNCPNQAITIGEGGVVSNNAIGGRGNVGISTGGAGGASGVLVLGNTVRDQNIGLSLQPDSGFGNNVLTNNTTQVSGGLQLGTNVCGTALCP